MSCDCPVCRGDAVKINEIDSYSSFYCVTHDTRFIGHIEKREVYVPKYSRYCVKPKPCSCSGCFVRKVLNDS